MPGRHRPFSRAISERRQGKEKRGARLTVPSWSRAECLHSSSCLCREVGGRVLKLADFVPTSQFPVASLRAWLLCEPLSLKVAFPDCPVPPEHPPRFAHRHSQHSTCLCVQCITQETRCSARVGTMAVDQPAGPSALAHRETSGTICRAT